MKQLLFKIKKENKYFFFNFLCSLFIGVMWKVRALFVAERYQEQTAYNV